jgi:hypothetical protein
MKSPTPSPTPNPTPDVSFNVAVASKGFGVETAKIHALSYQTMATSLRSGVGIADSISAMKSVAKQTYEEAFNKRFGSYLGSLVKEGEEPDSNAKGELATFYEGLAEGMMK